MAYNPQIHHRRTIRLKGYDYAQPGAYFVTICTQDRSNVLGENVNGEMHLSPKGQVAYDFWCQVCKHFPNVEALSYIVMPNHVHAIIMIHESPNMGMFPGSTPGRGVVPTPSDQDSAPRDGRGVVSTPPDGGNHTPRGRETLPLPDLGQIIGYYKYQTTKQVNAQNAKPGARFWQRNYYERVVRDQEELRRFSEYIR